MTELDFFDFARIKIAAFESGMPHLLIAPPITRDKIQQYADAELHEFRTAPDCRFVKVVDTTAGQSCMVACAKWRINPKERPADVVKHSLPRPTSSDADPAHKAQRDFFGYLAAHRWKHMGTRPFARALCRRPSRLPAPRRATLTGSQSWPSWPPILRTSAVAPAPC